MKEWICENTISTAFVWSKSRQWSSLAQGGESNRKSTVLTSSWDTLYDETAVITFPELDISGVIRISCNVLDKL